MYGSHRHSTWSIAHVPGQPAQRREHGALVGEGDVLVVRERLPRAASGSACGGWSPTPMTRAPDRRPAPRVKYAISAG